MRSPFILALVFACGLALGLIISPLRYSFIAVDLPSIYRCDRLTGKVEVASLFQQWRTVGLVAKQTKPLAETTYQGKPLAEMTYEELAALEKTTRASESK